MVAVDNPDEVLEFVVGGGHCGFPVGAFLAFAVAGHNDDLAVKTLETESEAHTHTDGQAVAERTGGRVAASDFLAVGVHTVGGLGLVEVLHNFVEVEIAPHSKAGDVGESAVAFGKNEAVSFVPVGVCGVDLQILEVQRDEHIGTRERTADVPRRGVKRGLNDVETQFFRLCFKLVDGNIVWHILPSCIIFLVETILLNSLLLNCRPEGFISQ